MISNRGLLKSKEDTKITKLHNSEMKRIFLVSTLSAFATKYWHNFIGNIWYFPIKFFYEWSDFLKMSKTLWRQCPYQHKTKTIIHNFLGSRRLQFLKILLIVFPNFLDLNGSKYYLDSIFEKQITI